VLSEFGVDSIREGRGPSLAKVVVKLRDGSGRNSSLSWTDECVYWRVCHQDWAFGLVDHKRLKKPAFHMVQQYYRAPLPPVLPEYPKVEWLCVRIQC